MADGFDLPQIPGNYHSVFNADVVRQGINPRLKGFCGDLARELSDTSFFP
jgi:hypothetical protein